jgi:hypothetical protein
MFDEENHSLDALGFICHLGFVLNTQHFRRLFSFHYETKVGDKPACSLDWARLNYWTRSPLYLQQKAEPAFKMFCFYNQLPQRIMSSKKGTDFTRYTKPQIKAIYSTAQTGPEGSMPPITKPDTEHSVEEKKSTCIYASSNYTQFLRSI